MSSSSTDIVLSSTNPRHGCTNANFSLDELYNDEWVLNEFLVALLVLLLLYHSSAEICFGGEGLYQSSDDSTMSVEGEDIEHYLAFKQAPWPSKMSLS